MPILRRYPHDPLPLVHICFRERKAEISKLPISPTATIGTRYRSPHMGVWRSSFGPRSPWPSPLEIVSLLRYSVTNQKFVEKFPNNNFKNNSPGAPISSTVHMHHMYMVYIFFISINRNSAINLKCASILCVF